MDPAILWRDWFSHLSSCAQRNMGLCFLSLSVYVAGWPSCHGLWVLDVLSYLFSLSMLFPLGLPRLTNIQLSLSQAPGSLKANFWKPFSTLKFKAGVVADSFPSLWHELRCQIQLDPLYPATPTASKRISSRAALTTALPCSKSSITLHYFQVQVSLLHTNLPSQFWLAATLYHFTLHKSPLALLPHARLIYLLSSTYFMSACLCLFTVSPPSLHLIMYKSLSPVCMAG